MLSSRVVSGPGEAAEPPAAGGAVTWTLANDGSVPWPAGTTLRLVGGPVVLCPVTEVPVVAPGQTLDVELEAQPVDEPAHVYYSLVTQDGQPFGEIAQAEVFPQHPPAPEPRPVVALVAAPEAAQEGGTEALQGEVKAVEWLLANTGQVKWPEDASADLVYNTPGFLHLPGSIDLPALDPGATVHAGVSLLMPECEGQWKAIWAVTSPTHADFGELLVAEFHVSDFPFMEWMLADEAKADSVSDVASSAPEKEEPPKKPLSVAVAMQEHVFQGGGDVEYTTEGGEADFFTSLGRVSGLRAGEPWVLRVGLYNDGAEAWPADAALTCCLGGGLVCGRVGLCGPGGEAVQAGETVLVQMELCAPPEAPCQTAWVVASGEACFGPAMVLDVA
mmetsp:Transcript_44152/g.133825  ORF Transcript_44152/g.133825 Transcript_44152/m.133825 type:complete len:389 (-) Transcript_44152:54-1220(-)